jgi:hypothetical protein
VRVNRLGFRVKGFRFRVLGFGFNVEGLRSKVCCIGFSKGLWFRVWDLWFSLRVGVYGLGVRVKGFQV